MGKEIEKILLSRGHVVSAIVDPMVETAHKEISAAVLADALASDALAIAVCAD